MLEKRYRLIVNGQPYGTIEDLPPEWKGLLKDADGDGIPDILQGDAAWKVVVRNLLQVRLEEISAESPAKASSPSTAWAMADREVSPDADRSVHAGISSDLGQEAEDWDEDFAGSAAAPTAPRWPVRPPPEEVPEPIAPRHDYVSLFWLLVGTIAALWLWRRQGL